MNNRKFEDRTSKLHTKPCKFAEHYKYVSKNTCWYLHFENELYNNLENKKKEFPYMRHVAKEENRLQNNNQFWKEDENMAENGTENDRMMDDDDATKND